MSVLKLSKVLPDGRVTEYHKVAELIFDTQPNHMIVKMASYVNKHDAFTQMLPDANFLVPIDYTGTYEDAATDVIGKVMSQPDWTGGELVAAEPTLPQ
jgi:hypothetical protein